MEDAPKVDEATLSANRGYSSSGSETEYDRLVFPFLQIATEFLNDALEVLNGRDFVAQWLGQLAGDAVGPHRGAIRWDCSWLATNRQGAIRTCSIPFRFLQSRSTCPELRYHDRI